MFASQLLGLVLLAHPLDIGYLRIDSTGNTITVALDLEVTVAAQMIAVEPAAMDANTTRTRAQDLASSTYRLAPITTDAGACAWKASAAALYDRTASMTGAAECPEGASTIRWELPFIEKMPPTFQLLVKAHGQDGERMKIVDQRAPVLELDNVSVDRSFSELVWSGAAHIGATPEEWHDDQGFKLPEGIDHVLFLLALLLAGGTVLQLIGIASGFTIGHSVTLALAALDVIRPPAALIEPLVALTIAFAALEAFTQKFARHRWKIATTFGLIHGFAFATALTELDLSGSRMVKSLFGYNLGVELGQIFFVLLFSAPILWLHKKPLASKLIVRSAAASIFVAGLYWFVDRTFV
jgi:hypothetical protein